MVDPRSRRDLSASFAHQVDEAITSAQTIQGVSDLVEDSDAWLDLDPEGLEELLRKKQGNEANLNEAHAERLGGLAEKFESFVDGQGALDGAMFDEYVRSHTLA